MNSNTKTSGMSVTAMILGIVGLVFIWAPFVGFICSLLGIIFGGVGMSQTRKNPIFRYTRNNIRDAAFHFQAPPE